MFGATRMLTAAAVVTLFGGVVLAGSVMPRAQDPVPAAAAAFPSAEPVGFEARWAFGGGGSEIERGDSGWLSMRDGRWAPSIVEAGDPRLEGDLSLVANGYQYRGIEIWNGSFRIENDAGAWQQRPMIQSVKRGYEGGPMTWTAVFDGEGAYADLVAIMGITRDAEGWDVEGLIVDAVLPPEPEVQDSYD